MEQIWVQVRELRGRPGAVAAFSIGVASMWLILIGIVGAIVVSDGTDDELASVDVDAGLVDDLAGGSGEQEGAAAGDPSAVDPSIPDIDPAGGEFTPPAPGVDVPTSAPAAPGGASAGPPGATPSSVVGASNPEPSLPAPPSGGDSTGVTASEIKIGVHGPLTVSGVPLNLAEDPINGVEAYAEYINQHGGINGRKIVLDIQTDDSGAEGARAAAERMINDNKDFMVSGTLGIDQVAIVAAEAAKRGVPYTAAGGNENKPIPGMFQLSASYTAHVRQLADYMKIDTNLNKRRVGILVSDSEYIRPVAADFKKRLEANGLTVSTTVVNQKPQTNPDYNGYILEFARTNTEVVVPLTDPVTTSQIVQRCAAGAACGWTYAFTNFAHDSETALALMTPTWATQRVRGLSSICYFTAPEINDPAKCANMAVARDQYVAVRGQDAWDDDGSGAAFGYQIINFLEGALRAPGADLTRERFTAALRAYQGYSDLVTGPISFVGAPNTMRGASRMAVYEAQPNNSFKMITPGLLDGF